MPKEKKKKKIGLLPVIIVVVIGIGILSSLEEDGGDQTSNPKPSSPTASASASSKPEPEKAKVTPEPKLPEVTFDLVQSDFNIRPPQVTLKVPASADIVLDGESVGEMGIAKGTVVDLVKIESDGTLKLAHNNTGFTANYEDTDLLERAKAVQKANEAESIRLAKAAEAEQERLTEEKAKAQERGIKESYDLGWKHGYEAGVRDFRNGYERRGRWARETGERMSTGMGVPVPEQYAKGYHEGYNQGWHNTKDASPVKR